MKIRNAAFDEFERAIVQAIEEHHPHFEFGTDEANDRAWKLGRDWAYRIWSEMALDVSATSAPGKR